MNYGYDTGNGVPIPPIDSKKRSGFGCLIGTMVGCGALTVMLIIVGALAVQNIGKNKDIQKALGQFSSIGGCSQNLVQVRDAIKRYRHDHHDQYPDALKDITPRYLANSRALWCGNGKDSSESLQYYRPVQNALPTAVVVRVKSLDIEIMGKQHQTTFLAIRMNGDIIQEQSAVQILIPANSNREIGD